MRYLLALVLALPAIAQSDQSEKQTLQALLAEVQQLRVAIERYTLLGTRTQLAISQLQLQESRVTRLSQTLADLKGQGASLTAQKARAAAELKRFEGALDLPESSTPEVHRGLESAITRAKADLEEATAFEQQRVAREADVSTQLDAAQAQLNESRSRIAEMERTLDAAIQQLIKPH